MVYDRLIPDRERHYSGLVADALGIPIHYHVVDDYQLFDYRERPELLIVPNRSIIPCARIIMDGFLGAGCCV